GVGSTHPGPVELDAELGGGLVEPVVGRRHPASIAELLGQVFHERRRVSVTRNRRVELERAVDDVDRGSGLLDRPLEPSGAHVAPRASHIAPDLDLHPLSEQRLWTDTVAYRAYPSTDVVTLAGAWLVLTSPTRAGTGRRWGSTSTP